MDALERIRRGCVDVVSEGELERKLRLARPLRVKLGVDPTSPDLHLGHTVVLSKLRTFQDMGHTAVLIIGDFTARIGDPSGRDVTRPPLEPAQIEAHARSYQEQAFKVLDPARTELRRNSEWLEPFARERLLATLRRVTVSQILEREDFQNRLKAGDPVTLLETLYPLLQGYDSVAVRADVELGGSDQLFNLLMGRQMQKEEGQEAQVALTLPLLVGLDGRKKMSKSYGNAIGVQEAPREMFGKLMKVSDALMLSYYELLTLSPLDAVRALHPMQAKKDLAQEITARFHGAEAASAERAFFESAFGRGEVPEDVRTLRVDPAEAATWSAFLTRIGAAQSRKEAQRLLAQGAVRVNEARVDKDFPLRDSPWPDWRGAQTSGRLVLKVGKHRFYSLELGT